MRAGLKILVSAARSRPGPPFFSATCPSGNFSRPDFVPRLVPNSGTHSSAHQGGATMDRLIRIALNRVSPRPMSLREDAQVDAAVVTQIAVVS